ncbi:hypothetical protein PLIIFM63780_010595 [Purpureocillium lilacinum]|nr:hypothetical protein PLIIFM63780_010595 [Purpureocillium lilacinum]
MSDQANSHVLFLFPLGDNAAKTIDANRHLRPISKHDHYDKDKLLDIGKIVPKQSNGFTIASIGRGPDADIRVQAVKEADLQASVWDQREAQFLARLKHPHVIQFLGSSESAIYMELMDGTLTALARDPAFTSESGRDELANRVFEPMIRALDYIDGAGLVHRDIKPDNIFYKRQGSGYILFKLGDFGLGNFAALAKSYVGSEMYMAPEYCETKKGRPAQPHKGDVWSLLVTMMWTLDVDDFRQASTSMNSRQQIHRAIKRRADHPRIRSIRRMAEFDPEKRASAADMVAVVAGPQHKASLIAPLHPACDDTFDAQDTKTRFGTVAKFSGRGLNTGSNIGDIDIGPPHRRLAEWQPDPSNQDPYVDDGVDGKNR